MDELGIFSHALVLGWGAGWGLVFDAFENWPRENGDCPFGLLTWKFGFTLILTWVGVFLFFLLFFLWTFFHSGWGGGGGRGGAAGARSGRVAGVGSGKESVWGVDWDGERSWDGFWVMAMDMQREKVQSQLFFPNLLPSQSVRAFPRTKRWFFSYIFSVSCQSLCLYSSTSLPHEKDRHLIERVGNFLLWEQQLFADIWLVLTSQNMGPLSVYPWKDNEGDGRLYPSWNVT